MPVSDSTVENARAAADHAAARAGVLPQYLQLDAQLRREHSPLLGEVQAIKSREVEHVRYRAVADYPHDVDLQAVLQAMRHAARDALPTVDAGENVSRLPWPPIPCHDGIKK